MHSVALLTPTFRKDIERFELLCESIDRWVFGYARHYVLVNRPASDHVRAPPRSLDAKAVTLV